MQRSGIQRFVCHCSPRENDAHQLLPRWNGDFLLRSSHATGVWKDTLTRVEFPVRVSPDLRPMLSDPIAVK